MSPSVSVTFNKIWRHSLPVVNSPETIKLFRAWICRRKLTCSEIVRGDFSQRVCLTRGRQSTNLSPRILWRAKKSCSRLRVSSSVSSLKMASFSNQTWLRQRQERENWRFKWIEWIRIRSAPSCPQQKVPYRRQIRPLGLKEKPGMSRSDLWL